MKSQIVNRYALTFASGLVILLSGCGNEILDQARKLSSTSEDLKKVFPVLAKDYVDSCFRKADYTLLLSNNQDVFAARNTALKACTDKLPSDLAPLVGRKKDIVGNSTIIEDASQAFITQNNVITGHLDAIGALSQKETFDFSSESGSLVDVLSRAGSELGGVTITDTQKTALESVIGFIFKAIAQDIARDALKKEIPKVNKSYQTVICFLRKDFNRIYRDSLDQEIEQLNQYYKSAIRLELQRTSSDFSLKQLKREKLRRELFNQRLFEGEIPVQFGTLLEVEAIYDEWRDKQAELRNRYAALDGYLRILDTISTGHSALAQIAESKAPRNNNPNDISLNQVSFNKETCQPINQAYRKLEGDGAELQLALISQYASTLKEQVSNLEKNKFISQKLGDN